MMITAHSMANDLLVTEDASGGFLFGIYSTLDKLSNGGEEGREGGRERR
jgi:hypothetical protein